jgi:hypothetical protein
MDLARFVMLLSDRTLWFAKATSLHDGDPYEGYGEASGFENIAKAGTYEPAEGLRRAISYMSSQAAAGINRGAEHLYINSWCLGTESVGMWRLYGANGRGVAIKSTIGRFMSSMKKNLRQDQYRFGKVEYGSEPASFVDAPHEFRASAIPVGSGLWQKILALAFNKRAAYEYEQEWRAAIYQDLRADVCGLDISFDIDGLIEGVIVGPTAGDVEVKAVAALTVRAGLSCAPRKSTLLAKPSL